MLSQAVDHSWDLTPVIDLIYSLSSKDDPLIAYNGSLPSAATQPAGSGQDGGSGGDQRLGNFDKLWEFLGQPFDTPPPVLEAPSLASGNDLPDEGRYNSGDAGSEQTPFRTVRWQDWPKKTNVPWDADLLTPLATPSKQKKKPKKKQHGDVLAQDVQLASYGDLPIIRTSSAEDSDTGLEQLQDPPDRKSIIYDILYGNTPNGKASNVYGGFLLPTSLSPFKRTKVPHSKNWSVSRTGQHNSQWQPVAQGDLSAAAKKAKLVLSLCERFPAEKDCISALGAPKNPQTSDSLASTAIHVFVDVSNVSLGLGSELSSRFCN